MQQQKLSEVNVGALERRTRYGPQRAPVQQFHPFEQSPSGARRKDATSQHAKHRVFHASCRNVETFFETKEKLGASCAEPGCALAYFFNFTKTGCEIPGMSVVFFPGHALQSAGAKCNSIRIQILAKQ